MMKKVWIFFSIKLEKIISQVENPSRRMLIQFAHLYLHFRSKKNIKN